MNATNNAAGNFPVQSIPGICEIEMVVPPGARPDSRPGVLIEVPHGATRRRHFEATRRRLTGSYPDHLEEFFYVNTDVGSIECARFVARMIASPSDFPELAGLPDAGASGGRLEPEGVLIVRGLVARTFVDFNRVVAVAGDRSGDLEEGLTPGLPAYVTDPEDAGVLLALHREYQSVAARAYDLVLGDEGSRDSGDGAGLILHTYAPRSVEIERVDEGIVDALHRAYEPEAFATLERRPAVDLITEAGDGRQLAPERLVREVRRQYETIGIETAENATYRLHESTMGYVHSSNHPGRILCIEINRELLAERFTPFREMSISDQKARRMAAPIAAAFLRCRTPA